MKSIVTPKFFILFSLVLSRLISFIAFPNATIFPDSSTYLPEKFMDFDLVSFSGNSFRPWPTPLFYSIFPSSSYAVFAVMVISLASWYFLINTILVKIQNSKKKWLFASSATILSCSPFVIQWENSILPPALLTSNLLLLLALSIKALSENVRSSTYYLGILLSGLFLLQKSSNILVAVIFVGIFLFRAFQKLINQRKLIITLFAGSILVYSGAVGINVNKHYKPSSYSDLSLLYQLGGQSPVAANLVNYLKTSSSAPKCFLSDAPFQDIHSDIGNILDNCPGSINYIKNDYLKDIKNFFLTNPVSGIKLAIVGFGVAFTTSATNYGSAVGIFPGFASGIFFGEVQPKNYFEGSNSQVEAFNSLSSGKPIWIYAPGLLIIFAPMLLLICYRKKIEILQEMRFLAIIQLGLLLELTLTYVFIPTEWVRLGSHYFIVSLFAGLTMVFSVQSRKSTLTNQ